MAACRAVAATVALKREGGRHEASEICISLHTRSMSAALAALGRKTKRVSSRRSHHLSRLRWKPSASPSSAGSASGVLAARASFSSPLASQPESGSK